MPYRTEIRRTVIKVIEWEDGKIYKTEEVGRIWLDDIDRTFEEENEIARQHGGDMLGSMSISAPYGEWMRSVKYGYY